MAKSGEMPLPTQARPNFPGPCSGAAQAQKQQDHSLHNAGLLNPNSPLRPSVAWAG